MKILVICQYYFPEPFRISDICEELVKKGHNVTVVTGLPNYPEGKVLNEYRNRKKRTETINGVKVIRCFEIGRGKNKVTLFINYISYAVSASLKTLFLNEKYDAILVNQLSPVMMGLPAIVYKKKYKKKILLYCLDLWPASLAAGGINESSFIYKIFLALSRWIYRSMDYIAVSSAMFKDYLGNSLGINKETIFHLPQYAEALFLDKLEARQNSNFNFVFAGNIGDMQSVDTIIKAANELTEHQNITFHIVGDGSKLEECKALSNELNLQNVIFYGRKPVSEMPYYYGLADAMLITLKDDKTISTTLPGKLQSYMAASKPIIGAINGEAKQVIQEAQCGFCCDAENHQELAKLILLFCMSDKKEQIAKNSYDYYCNNFSKEKFMAVLEQTLVKMEV